MRYRELGRSGPRVSEIGYGAWGIGESSWVGATEDESVRALHRAVDLGVNFIDTAPGYGESERIVGQVVRERAGDDVLVATKVPPKNGVWPPADGTDPAAAFPGEYIRTSLETSPEPSGRARPSDPAVRSGRPSPRTPRAAAPSAGRAGRPAGSGPGPSGRAGRRRR